ncbi:hypothetical protein [Bacillus infantis]|uniref:hypothetical protein n=1 Tax=Bacillus infantis TaxID=324767 RepID=UPI003CEB5661
MNTRELESLLNTDPFAMYSAIMSSIAAQEAKLTPEERELRKIRRQLMNEQRIKRQKVMDCICPVCDDGKLVRGKKEKKAGYKRLWTCSSCDVRVMDDGSTFEN